MKNRPRGERIFSGSFYFWMEKAFDGITLNLLWLLGCLPVITAGASTTALYYAAVKNLRFERGHLIGEFRRSFKVNFFKSVLLFLILGGLFFIILVNRNIVPDIDGGYFGFFLFCFYTFLGVLIIAVALYTFPCLSRFDMGILWILKIAIYMTFRYIHYTLGILALLALAVFMIVNVPFFIFILPSPIVILMSYLIERVLKKHSTPVQENAEYKWYLNAAGGGTK
ncbi:MAG: DUF624 domain-containing protein [Treponema sp.]|jgi:uncharacterized membrane protein YesL|nr:DUF624 domain-containing protein [Treponema sp.]